MGVGAVLNENAIRLLVRKGFVYNNTVLRV